VLGLNSMSKFCQKIRFFTKVVYIEVPLLLDQKIHCPKSLLISCLIERECTFLADEQERRVKYMLCIQLEEKDFFFFLFLCNRKCMHMQIRLAALVRKLFPFLTFFLSKTWLEQSHLFIYHVLYV
jgi:hypothetical protein